MSTDTVAGRTLQSTTPEVATSLGPSPLSKNFAQFGRPAGPDLLARTDPYYQWIQSRRAAGLWSYQRAVISAPGAQARVLTYGGDCAEGVNFASQDYLSLSSEPEVIEAGIAALRDYGPHSASSGMFAGDTGISLRLESALAEALDTKRIVLFPTGWLAGYGAITGLVRPDDYVLLDSLAHACLQQGAAAATQKVTRFPHLDNRAVRDRLREIRATDARHAILVVSEGLYSMSSDTPDILELQDICHEFGAALLLDIAHDFGSTGPFGGGQLEIQGALGKVDLLIGAFSKSFASNGGFVATQSDAVAEYVKVYAPSYTFTNTLSPVQAATVLKALEIARSHRGELLRGRLHRNAIRMREEFLLRGIECIGQPSPVIPVPISNVKIGRVASSMLLRRNVFTNLAEYPAVPLGSARFRMQLMAAHTDAHILHGVNAVVGALDAAAASLANLDGDVAVVNQRV